MPITLDIYIGPKWNFAKNHLNPLSANPTKLPALQNYFSP